MSSHTAQILEMLKSITADVAQLKLDVDAMRTDNTQAAQSADTMYRALNVKFDMLKNLEATSREAIANTSARSTKPTRPAFFKQIFTDERNLHVGTLYSQEDIDAAFADANVQAKKKEADRNNKAAAIVYASCIKGDGNKERFNAFESLYSERTSA